MFWEQFKSKLSTYRWFEENKTINVLLNRMKKLAVILDAKIDKISEKLNFLAAKYNSDMNKWTKHQNEDYIRRENLIETLQDEYNLITRLVHEVETNTAYTEWISNGSDLLEYVS